jgi:hypothetical protein
MANLVPSRSDNGKGHPHKRTIRNWSQHATFLQIRLRQQLNG